jgi:hypothetical protein
MPQRPEHPRMNLLLLEGHNGCAFFCRVEHAGRRAAEITPMVVWLGRDVCFISREFLASTGSEACP